MRILLLFGSVIFWGQLAHASPAFEETLSSLGKMQTEMKDLISQAKNCLPHTTKNGVEFCTGILIPSSELEKMLALDVKSCQKQIESKGYQSSWSWPKALLTKAEYDSFFNSTKRAETFHEKKTVLFKEGVSNRIDCIHELMHVTQWTQKTKSKLAPPNRRKTSDTYTGLLENGAGAIEGVEKSGNQADAQKMADRLTEKLNTLKEWEQLTDWLDEKEVHYFIYENCGTLTCQLSDKDAALANLWKRREYLPKSYLPELDREAGKVLDELKSKNNRAK